MTVTLGWGLKRALPEGVTCAWGARWIAPNDMVSSRQDLQGEGEQRSALIEWLNGGAIAAARQRAVDLRYTSLRGDVSEIVTLYEDERGIIRASTNASHGYVYVTGWLYEHEEA